MLHIISMNRGEKMLGIRLKTLRIAKNKTQQDMANYIGVTRPAYTAYEQGNRTPDNETVEKLADFHDVTIDYLFGRTDNPNSIDNVITTKDEKDIAKRMEQLRKDLANADGLAFDGEPMSDEAVESLLEALEHAERIATLANKKYIPKKYRED